MSPLWRIAGVMVVMLEILVACRPGTNLPASDATGSQKLKVVATTNILGDVVKQIGGQAVELTILLPAGTDPHTYEPSPQDITSVANADLVIVNGADLENFWERLIANAGAKKVIAASDGIEFRDRETGPPGQGGEGEHGDSDPHVWFNPQNVIIWTENIERELSSLDPKDVTHYAANAKAYRSELAQLDAWIEKQVSQIPSANRKLVTDHQTFGYFADRYGFEQVGAVIPSFSAGAAPSAQQIANLQDAIRDLGVGAIFIGSTVSPDLAQRLAEDTGVQLVALYTDSLTPPGGEADSYLALMRFDTNALVEALK